VTKQSHVVGVMTAATILLAIPMIAQEPAAQKSPMSQNQTMLSVPLKVQLVISKYQGERKISSVPYVLALNSNEGPARPTHLRMHTDVPYSMTPISGSSDGKPVAGIKSYAYKTVGTSIDCSAISFDNGGFKINVSIEDSSIQPAAQGASATTGADAVPAFRTFTSLNTVLLKDGQTVQLTIATDPISGEVTKVDVTLTVTK
jgi:hypothetical protein